ncbi:MAG TPA: sensor histidine kinase [Caulobacteraceae bacterium]|nr:sensor histidine kinase [Caulobacteraceae bacterium]
MTTIRVRLVVALAAALLPVLILGASQSVLSFRHDAETRQAALEAAAQRSAASARARMESAAVLLETLAPGSVGFQCAQRLSEITRRIPGYDNLIRFDSRGRVACAAATVPADPLRSARPWFSALRSGGEDLIVTSRPGVTYAGEPALLAATRAEGPAGFDGALAAVITLSSLRPELSDRTLPQGAEVAVVDRQGNYLNITNADAFPRSAAAWVERAADSGGFVGHARDADGRRRVYSAAPLVRNEVFVILSAPSRSIYSWAWLNPLSGIVFPVLAFLLALGAVFYATERGVVRWIAYLQRIAAIYARGRFSVRPVQAERAPPEIRELAHTLGDMAETIVARDQSIRDSLTQKDSLLREIHHRVKNNLQVISSLLNMQQRALSDPSAKAAISDTRQRIAALALIYRALYQGPDLKRVDLRSFLEELTAQLLTGDGEPHGSIRTEVNADALVIDPDKLAPLALFAVEAVTNAQKHAFNGSGGVLRVDFHVLGAEAELSISDNGTKAGGEAGPGVGRTLMTAFARQLRGRAEFERNTGGGTTVRLTFPTPEAGT